MLAANNGATACATERRGAATANRLSAAALGSRACARCTKSITASSGPYGNTSRSFQRSASRISAGGTEGAGTGYVL